MKTLKIKTRNKKGCGKESGFTMLYGILIITTVLYITLGISNVVLRQVALSSLGRESGYAFYAADTAAECALYEDFKNGAFSGAAMPVECAGVTKTPSLGGTAPLKVYDFRWDFSEGTSPIDTCADVTVLKNTLSGATTLLSRGYNTCVPSASRRVERSLRLDY